MNMAMNEQIISLDIFSLALGAMGGFLLALFICLGLIFSLSRKKAALQATLETERHAMEGHFQGLASAALKANAENFLTLAQEKLKQAQASGAHDLDKRSEAIAQMVKPVEKYLEQLKGAVDQLHGTDKAIRDDLKSLQSETAKLTGALRNPAAQGKWGEFVLERLLDKANLIKGIHYETQVVMDGPDGARQRPDVVIHLQDGFNIVIDAKAPITEFINRLEEEMTESARMDLARHMAKAVRSHIKALGGRGYWEQLDSPDFVVLFLPSEHIFSTALMADPTLVDYAAENQVVVASPTLMISLLRVVGLSWRQAALAKNAQEISKLGGELYDRISSFKGHLEKVGKGIEGALGAYNKAVGAIDSRVLVSARKLRELQGADPVDMDAPAMIETAARPLSVAQDNDQDDMIQNRYGS